LAKSPFPGRDRSFLTSCARAKIESLGRDCRVGGFRRLERLTALIVSSAGAAFDVRLFLWGLAVVGAAANVTAWNAFYAAAGF